MASVRWTTEPRMPERKTSSKMLKDITWRRFPEVIFSQFFEPRIEIIESKMFLLSVNFTKPLFFIPSSSRIYSRATCWFVRRDQGKWRNPNGQRQLLAGSLEIGNPTCRSLWYDDRRLAYQAHFTSAKLSNKRTLTHVSGFVQLLTSVSDIGAWTMQPVLTVKWTTRARVKRDGLGTIVNKVKLCSFPELFLPTLTN